MKKYMLDRGGLKFAIMARDDEDAKRIANLYNATVVVNKQEGTSDETKEEFGDPDRNETAKAVRA